VDTTPRRYLLAASVCAALATSTAAEAVSLGADGRGQALIYPYYTVQSSAGNPFHTYLSVVNQTAQAKAVRVRVREARNSREVASFNLYLSPNDVWAGAIVPMLNTLAPRLVTADRSCVLPTMTGTVEEPNGVNFRNDLYSGALDDGMGSGLDRTREGWVEIIEMASLTGALGTGVTHNSAGMPINCAVVQSPSASDIAAPTGGLSGTLTLINVASGMDFTINAEALADLSTRSFYRPPGDAYPDFNAVEIDPVSVVVANGSLYRSTWNRGVDAVSAVLMRASWIGEYVLDTGTSSRSDAVLTFPTRHFYFAGPSLIAPFATCTTFNTFAGQPSVIRWFGRESQGGIYESFGGVPPLPVMNFRCSAVSVMDFANAAAHTQSFPRSGVLGSDNRAVAEGQVTTGAAVQNGWFSVTPTAGQPLTSLGTSTRMNLANGSVTTGAHAFSGLPVVGFAVRTFVNGTLACSAVSCQGNYGGSFPLKFRRAITPN
jgi:hypothetical protein